MAQTVLIRLGPFKFSIRTLNLQDLDRIWDYRWEAVNRVGERPAMQFMGPGEETVGLRGIIYPHYMGGFGQLERMRESAAGGNPYHLATGYGRNYGKWCIKSIGDQHTLLFPDGSPRKVEFDIDLVHY